MNKLYPRHVTPEMAELYKLVRKSEKFLNWNKPPDKMKPQNPALAADEKHWSVIEVAEQWGISTDLVRDVFKGEDGVLIFERPRTRTKRAYSTMRIPQSVLERVYARMSER